MRLRCVVGAATVWVSLGCSDGGSVPSDAGPPMSLDRPSPDAPGDAERFVDAGARLDEGVDARADGNEACPLVVDSRQRLAIGFHHGCALDSAGRVVCWGMPQRDVGQTRSPAGKFVDLSASGAATCARTEAGTVSCWGAIDPAPPITFHRIAVTDDLACGIGDCGRVTCWGANAHNVQPPPQAFLRFGVGDQLGCGITDTGRLRCFGIQRAVDVLSPPDGNFVDLSVGEEHACALDASGSLACWGLGALGQPTDGSDAKMWSYGQAIPPAGRFVGVSAGLTDTCVLAAAGNAICWGAGSTNVDCANTGHCGQALPPQGPFQQVQMAYTHACALRAEGSIACWGSNTEERATPPILP